MTQQTSRLAALFVGTLLSACAQAPSDATRAELAGAAAPSPAPAPPADNCTRTVLSGSDVGGQRCTTLGAKAQVIETYSCKDTCGIEACGGAKSTVDYAYLGTLTKVEYRCTGQQLPSGYVKTWKTVGQCNTSPRGTKSCQGQQIECETPSNGRTQIASHKLVDIADGAMECEGTLATTSSNVSAPLSSVTDGRPAASLPTVSDEVLSQLPDDVRSHVAAEVDSLAARYCAAFAPLVADKVAALPAEQFQGTFNQRSAAQHAYLGALESLRARYGLHEN